MFHLFLSPTPLFMNSNFSKRQNEDAQKKINQTASKKQYEVFIEQFQCIKK